MLEDSRTLGNEHAMCPKPLQMVSIANRMLQENTHVYVHEQVRKAICRPRRARMLLIALVEKRRGQRL